MPLTSAEEFLARLGLPVGSSLACDAQLQGWVAAEQGDELSEEGVELAADVGDLAVAVAAEQDRKSTRLNSSHQIISYAVFCLKKKNKAHSCRSTRCEARDTP